MSADFRFSRVIHAMGRRRVLKIPELIVGQGDCLVLTGRNGAGKTTLLKILSGLLAPDQAWVTVGADTQPWRHARHALRHHTVYVHQHPYVFDASVADNVAYGLKRSALVSGSVDRLVKETLEWSDLAHLAHRNAQRLSAGERQRVAFARARVLSPSILLLDEPTASLDAESRERTFFLLRRLKSEGISVVLATHEPLPGLQLGDQYLRLVDGRLSVLPDVARPVEETASVPETSRRADNRWSRR